MKKIILVRPYGSSGGTLVIDRLCKLLREHSVDARLFYPPDNPIIYEKDFDSLRYKLMIPKSILMYLIYKCFHFYFKRSESRRALRWNKRYTETMSGLKRQFFPIFSKRNTIVLYPEVFCGNFLHAKNVVRWLLYYNRFKKNPQAFGDKDLIICYRKQFNDWDLNPDCKTVEISFFDSSIYKQYNYKKRDGKCFLIRKGNSRFDLPSHFDGPVIDYGMDEEEIVRIFNTTKYCYSYDTQTFYTKVAAVCGCIPIVVMEPGKNKRDYLTEEECADSVGVAYGDTPEEIQYAIDTRNQLLQRLDYSKSNEDNIRKFIQYITEKFGE